MRNGLLYIYGTLTGGSHTLPAGSVRRLQVRRVIFMLGTAWDCLGLLGIAWDCLGLLGHAGKMRAVALDGFDVAGPNVCQFSGNLAE